MPETLCSQVVSEPRSPLVDVTRRTRARAGLYALLGEVFGAAPTPARVRALSNLAAELGVDCPCHLPISALTLEYMELFVVPNPRYVAPYAPSEAMARSGAGVRGGRDWPDHIALEMRFLSRLWEQEVECPGASASHRQQFLGEHVMQWFGDFRDRVASRDRLGFYRVAVQITETVLQDDLE